MRRRLRCGWWVVVLAMFGMGAGGQEPMLEPMLVQAVKAPNLEAVRALVEQASSLNVPDATGATALHWAVQRSDAEMVALLLDAGANARAANRHGVTPMELAAVNGHAGIIERLVKAGAEVDAVSPTGGQTPLMSAARTGVASAIKVLLAHGADVNARQRETGQTALMWAAAENNVEAIQVLLEADAELEAYSGRLDAPKLKHRQVILRPTSKEKLIGLLSAYHSDVRMLDTSGYFTPFHFAVRAGHFEATKALLAAGADVNRPTARGRRTAPRPRMSPLVLAVHNAHYELAAYLLDQGADVDADAGGWTALHQVARMRGPFLAKANPEPTGRMDSLELARRLLARGANPNARMSADWRDGYRNRINWLGATPLFVAAKNIDLDLVRLVLADGADPSIKNVDDLTPLHVASGVSLWNPGEDFGTRRVDDPQALEVAKLLVSAGNDPNAVAANGETPLHGAAYTGRNSLVQYLADLGVSFEVENLIGWTPLRIADGVHYNGFAKYQRHTAAFIRELMAARGRSVPELQSELDLYYAETLKHRDKNNTVKCVSTVYACGDLTRPRLDARETEELEDLLDIDILDEGAETPKKKN